MFGCILVKREMRGEKVIAREERASGLHNIESHTPLINNLFVHFLFFSLDLKPEPVCV